MFSTNTYIQSIYELSINSKGHSKYLKWYISIIENAKNKITKNYTEKHHIVPDCFFIDKKRKSNVKGFLPGNPNLLDNIVKLTPREHFIVHLLLVKMFSQDFILIKSLMYSVYMMTFDRTGNRYNNKTYALTKKIYSKALLGNQHAKAGKGIPKSKTENYLNNKNRVNKKATLETKQKLSLAKIGNQNRKGIPHTEQSKLGCAKGGKAQKGIPKRTTECPYCKLIGSIANLKRYHFDNCKYK